jgi:hypothetical protein
MPVMFGGSYLVTPTVVSAIDDSQMYPDLNPSGNVLALIGESAGGLPKKPTRVRSPYHARQVLKSGTLYEACLRAFAPASEIGSPAVVYVVRANPATQSTATLKNAANAAIINLKSSDYGALTTTLAVRLELAQDSASYIVSVRQGAQVYRRENIGAQVFSIKYNGTSPATANWKVAAGKLTIEAPNLTVLKEYALANYTNAAALVEAMAADLGADWAVALTRGQEQFVPANLDALTVADAKTLTMATGHAWAVLNYINSSADIFLEATFAAELPVAAPAACAWTSLTGGTDYGGGNGIVTTDWEDCFEALSEMDVNWIVPLTASEAVWDLAAAHCDYMSAHKHERRAFIGAGTGVTEAQARMHAITINSERVGYVWPGVYDYHPVTNALTLYPAYLAAVHVAAGFASINPGVTMSRKAISVAGAEVLLHEPTDTDALLECGVIPLVQSKKGVIVSQAISTWQTDARYNRHEISVGAAVDYVANMVRTNLEMLLGERASFEVMGRAKSRLESILSDLSVPPPIGPGILVGDPAHPSYRNIIISLSGDVLNCSFECSPVIPINYILIPISISPYRNTLSST